jgi:hypothetical protein
LHQDGIAVVGVGCAAGQFDAADTAVLQGFEFAALADAVLVQIAPDAQIGVLGVCGIKLAVGIAVKRSQGGKAVGGLVTIGQNGFVTKEFGARVNLPVAIKVTHQHAVASADPGGAGLDGIAIGIEQDAFGQRCDLQAVAVEVQDQGIDVVDGFDLRVRGAAEDGGDDGGNCPCKFIVME